MTLKILKQKINKNLKDWKDYAFFAGFSTFTTLVFRSGGVSNFYNLSRALNTSSSVMNLTEKVIKVSLPISLALAASFAASCYLEEKGNKIEKAINAASGFATSMVGSSAAAFGGVVGAAAMSTIASGFAVPVAGVLGALTASYLGLEALKFSPKAVLSTATALASRNTISNLHHITNVLTSSSSISLSVIANLTKTVLKVSLPVALAQAAGVAAISYMDEKDVKKAATGFASSMVGSTAASVGGVVGAAAMSTVAAGLAVPVAGVVGAFTAAHAAKALEPTTNKAVNYVIGKFTSLLQLQSNTPRALAK